VAVVEAKTTPAIVEAAPAAYKAAARGIPGLERHGRRA
jgi:hypothetical protein